ncbi:glucan endo-1,3-beta-glucosidase [Trifolium repens]|nr:glucan endo-1,3-beta-glucosidase [Trifolium repens]
MVQIFLPFFPSISSRSFVFNLYSVIFQLQLVLFQGVLSYQSLIGEPEKQAIDSVNTTPSEEAKEKETSSVEEPKDYANGAVNNIDDKRKSDGEAIVEFGKENGTINSSKQEKLGGDDENEGAEKVSLNVEDIKAEGELVQEALNAVVNKQENQVPRKMKRNEVQSFPADGCSLTGEEQVAELVFRMGFGQHTVLVLGNKAFVGTYGVNYGRVSDNLPPPESVVTLLKAAKIKNIRIYDVNPQVLSAFKGSGIGIIVCLPNELLTDIGVAEDRAMNWIKDNVQPYLPGTKIVGISIGNEILGSGDVGVWEALLPASKNIYSSLDRLGLAHAIEVSTPHSEAVFANSYPPSSCTFRDDILPYMKPLLQFFSQIGTPFYINAYPFLAYKNDPSHIDINYALFKKNPGIYDAKSKLHYDNMFDAQIDAAYFALEKVGFDKMEVIVGETGWASHGDDNEAGATVKNAKTYNKNMRKRLLKRKGTPHRPKMLVRAYIFALFNENLKPGPTSERNFGLFKHDGSIAYDIGFTGLRPSSATSSFLSFKGIGSSYVMVSTSCIAILLFFL